MNSPRDLNERRQRFMAMLQEAEGERDGFAHMDALAEELDAIIAEAIRAASP